MATFRQKFEESQNRALSQIIATKILREMTELRSQAQESKLISRRWIWELIQNAKDVHNDGVDIQVNLKIQPENSKVTFKHNGKPFSVDNIRFLIEQISTKDREKDEHGKRKTTGKFGTGFLSTHLLSEIVIVRGVAKDENLEPRKFKMTLDRSGFELSDITKAVQIAKDSVIDLDDIEPYFQYDESEYNTSFIFQLTDDFGLTIAKEGLKDLHTCLPYALIFVEEINSVYTVNNDQLYHAQNVKTESGIEFFTVLVEEVDNEGVKDFQFIKLSNNYTSIALPIKIKNDLVEILQIDATVPKLFCDFPLIGTEIFPFPVVINNPHFNPTDPRDGVFLTNTDQRSNPTAEENKVIIEEAIQLYYELLEYAIKNEWQNLHLLAQITAFSESPKWVSKTWFNETVLSPIRKKIIHAKIITTADNKLAPIRNLDGKEYVWFPSAHRETREKIWELASYWFPHQLPSKSNVDLWYRLAWDECGKLTLDKFAQFVQYKGSISELKKVLKKIDIIEWLNRFYDLLLLNESEFHVIMEKHSIIPDQNGDFRKKSQLNKDAGNIDEDFKDILEGFDNRIREKLAHNEIQLEFGENTIDQNFVVKEIVSEVNQKTADRENAGNYRIPLNQLLIYFRRYPEKSKKLFPTIFKNKHLLYDDEEILENIDKAEQLDDLFREFNVSTTDDLRNILANSNGPSSELLPITQDLLANLGISNLEEWQEALKDQDLKALFAHDSVPTEDMFFYAQSLIADSKERVIEHISNLDEYNLEEMDDQTATTILAGIYKNSQPISVVFRPAYDGKVIIYYGSERDTLDYEPSELWVDTGSEVKQITLGHILKSAQIRKFPI